MIKKAKEQWNTLNWLHVALSVVLTAGLIGGMLRTVAWTHMQSKGDTRWADREFVSDTFDKTMTKGEIISIISTTISRAITEHQSSDRFHPPARNTSDRLDSRYVTRREFENDIKWIKDTLTRIETTGR